MLFDRDRMKTAASRLASQGVCVGTSSWKYPGWRGMLYDENRYITRGKFSDVDRFLGQLPTGWPYGVEIRNKNFLHPECFGVLRQHGVAHVFNSWADMPSVKDHLTLDGSRTNRNLCAARFLLRPGRKYQEAVDLFAPYDKIKEPNADARAAGAALVKEGVEAGRKKKTFIYVNNRLAGNALETIAAIADAIDLEVSTAP